MPIVHQPFAYSFGPLQFTGFGIAVLLGFVVAGIIGKRELARRGHDAGPIDDLVFAAVVGSLICAKLYYVALTGDITTLWSRGGFVFWGGLIGGILAVLLALRIKRIPPMRIADVAGLGVMAAYSVGRTGCWAVGDDYGRPWHGPLSVEFPNGAPASTVANMVTEFGIKAPLGLSPSAVLAVYPTQLIEVTLAFVLFLVLWRLRDHKHAEGWLFGLYMVLAGLERFLVEFLRAKDDRFFGGLTMAQVIAIGFMLAGAVWMQARRRVGDGSSGIYAGRAVA